MKDKKGDFWKEFKAYRTSNPQSHMWVAVSCVGFSLASTICALLAIYSYQRIASGQSEWWLMMAVGAIWCPFYVLKIFVRIHLHWPSEST